MPASVIRESETSPYFTHLDSNEKRLCLCPGKLVGGSTSIEVDFAKPCFGQTGEKSVLV